jgi:DNA polymerase III sliding clamp (beta) subunit (PCNA family)
MKVNNAALLRALEGPFALASKRASSPALNCVKFSAKGGTLTVAGSNLDAYQEMRLACEGALAPTCIHVARLRQLSDYGDGDVEFKLANGDRLEMVGKHSAKIPTTPLLGFPDAPAMDGKPIVANRLKLIEAIKAVSWCIYDKTDRPNLRGVNFAGNEVCATTGYAVALLTLEEGIGDRTMFVPDHALDSILKCLDQEEAELHDSDTHLFVVFAGGMLAAKKFATAFVPYKNVFPKDLRRIGTISREALITTIRPAVSVYDESFAKTRFEFGPDGCNVSQESNHEFNSVIPGEFLPLRFATNGRAMLKAVEKSGDEIELHGVDHCAPMLLKSGNLQVVICATAW